MEKHVKITLALLIALVIISLATQYHGSTDMHEYAGAAKFFAGKYNADLRASHSVLYGYVHAPLLKFSDSFLSLKILNLIYLILIILSVYHISNKNKKTLLLITLSPIIWYMGPWINPIQLASLLFLWGFHFTTKFHQTNNNKFLIYAGILIGLSAAFWNTALYVAFFLAICFFYNKNVNSLFIFLFSLLIGLTPLFILEQSLFGFPLYSFTKTNASNLLAFFGGGIYPKDLLHSSILDYLPLIIIIPLFTYLFFLKKHFMKSPRTIIFISLTLAFYLINPQIRYLLLIVPIITLILGETLSQKQFKKQLLLFIIIILIVLIPYITQIYYSTNSPELRIATKNFGKWDIYPSESELINSDLSEITKTHPNEVFIIGPGPNDYVKLAFSYWGDDIKEFVSIEDYNLVEEKEKTLFKKRFETQSTIQNRRQIWIEGGINKNPNDDSNYDEINYAISLKKPLDLEDFTLIKKYKILYLYEKSTPQ